MQPKDTTDQTTRDLQLLRTSARSQRRRNVGFLNLQARRSSSYPSPRLQKSGMNIVRSRHNNCGHPSSIIRQLRLLQLKIPGRSLRLYFMDTRGFHRSHLRKIHMSKIQEAVWENSKHGDGPCEGVQTPAASSTTLGSSIQKLISWSLRKPLRKTISTWLDTTAHSITTGMSSSLRTSTSIQLQRGRRSNCS